MSRSVLGRIDLAQVGRHEAAYLQIGNNPAGNSPRWGHDLNLLGLRSQKLKRFPYLVFFMEGSDHVDVWRILHAERDIPAWLQGGKDTWI